MSVTGRHLSAASPFAKGDLKEAAVGAGEALPEQLPGTPLRLRDVHRDAFLLADLCETSLSHRHTPVKKESASMYSVISLFTVQQWSPFLGTMPTAGQRRHRVEV